MSLRPALGVALLLAACADEPAVDVGAQQNPAEDELDAGPEILSPRVEFIGLNDWLPAQTTTRVLATAPEGVVRVELYLDGARVGEALFAPFELTWNTRPFGEGSHELRALAYLADGATAEVRRTVGFDHTPPVANLPELAGYPEPFAVAATDSPSGVAQVILTEQDGSQRVVEAEPFDFEWVSGCGSRHLNVAVVDRAGNRIELQRGYQATDSRDADCDGHRALAFPGGGDCNDAASWIHPGSTDTGEIAIDFNCDGVPGVDSDHDGVANTGTHGSDCNDADPAVYGPVLEWLAPLLTPDVDPAYGMAVVQDGVATGVAHRGYTEAGAQLVWSSHVVTDSGSFTLGDEVVYTGLGSPSVMSAAPGPVIAFGDGAALRLARRGASGWDIETVQQLGEAEIIDDVEVAVDSSGGVHLAFRAWNPGAQLGTLYQARSQAGGWEIEMVSQENPGLPRLTVASDDVPHLLYPVGGYYLHSRGLGATRTTTSLYTEVGPAFAADVRPSADVPGGVEVYAIARSWWSGSQEYVYRGQGVDEIVLDQLVSSPMAHPYEVSLGRDDVIIGTYSTSYLQRTSPAGFAWQPLPGGVRLVSDNGPLVAVAYEWPVGLRLVVPSGHRDGAGCL